MRCPNCEPRNDELALTSAAANEATLLGSVTLAVEAATGLATIPADTVGAAAVGI